MGLSITTCLPADNADLASGKWDSLGVAITTRSISLSANNAWDLACTVTSGYTACTFAASPLTTADNSRPGAACIRGA